MDQGDQCRLRGDARTWCGPPARVGILSRSSDLADTACAGGGTRSMLAEAKELTAAPITMAPEVGRSASPDVHERTLSNGSSNSDAAEVTRLASTRSTSTRPLNPRCCRSLLVSRASSSHACVRAEGMLSASDDTQQMPASATLSAYSGNKVIKRFMDENGGNPRGVRCHVARSVLLSATPDPRPDSFPPLPQIAAHVFRPPGAGRAAQQLSVRPRWRGKGTAPEARRGKARRGARADAEGLGRLHG